MRNSEGVQTLTGNARATRGAIATAAQAGNAARERVGTESVESADAARGRDDRREVRGRRK